MPARSPLPRFHFSVEFGGQLAGFTEVSGLTMEFQAAESRGGPSTVYSTNNTPGMRKCSTITLKRGIVEAGDGFVEWLSTVKQNAVERRNLIIRLLNEQRLPVSVWKVHNAVPVKVTGPGLKATGNEVAIESVELSHEGLELLKE